MNILFKAKHKKVSCTNLVNLGKSQKCLEAVIAQILIRKIQTYKLLPETYQLREILSYLTINYSVSKIKLILVDIDINEK